MDYLLNLRERMGNAKELLTDRTRLTSFFFVTLPEALPIAVITPLHQLVPRVRHPGRRRDRQHADRQGQSSTTDTPGLRQEPRGDAGRATWRRSGSTFPDVRAVVPLFETEVQGVKMLRRTAEYLFA